MIASARAISCRRDARRALQRMLRPTAERIVAKIEAYAVDPASQANIVKALKGEEAIRLRVGDWRVIMLDGEVLDIVRIAPRGSVYD